MNTFAQNLKAFRKDHEISQATLGKAIGYSQTTISEWERGVNPPIDALWKIADYFDITVDILIGRAEY